MAIRLKTKWSNKDRERSPKELASALAFTIWRIGMEGVLNLENEGFQTESQSQRMDITAEQKQGRSGEEHCAPSPTLRPNSPS